MTSELRSALHTIVDLQRRLEVQEAKHVSAIATSQAEIAKLQRALKRSEATKKAALTRAQKATEQARYWHGIALRFAPAMCRREAA